MGEPIDWQSIFEVAVVNGCLICIIQSGYPKAPHVFDWAVNDAGDGRRKPRTLGEGRCTSRDAARAKVADTIAAARL